MTTSDLHARLRSATRANHELLDQMMSRLNLGNRDDYAAFLVIHQAALAELSSCWSLEDEPDFYGLAQSLDSDLTELTAAIRSPSPRHGIADDAHALGVAYVIRGSRLGGAVLRTRVPPRLPTAYLDFKPTITWRQFLARLSQPNPPAESAQSVLAGAQHAFAVFQESCNRLL